MWPGKVPGAMPSAFRPPTEFALLIRDAFGVERDVFMFMTDATAARCWDACRSGRRLANGDAVLGMVKAPDVWKRQTP